MKRLLKFLPMILALAMFLIMPLSASADSCYIYEKNIFDNANILTHEEIEDFESRIDSISSRYGIEILIYTYPEGESMRNQGFYGSYINFSYIKGGIHSYGASGPAAYDIFNNYNFSDVLGENFSLAVEEERIYDAVSIFIDSVAVCIEEYYGESNIRLPYSNVSNSGFVRDAANVLTGEDLDNIDLTLMSVYKEYGCKMLIITASPSTVSSVGSLKDTCDKIYENSRDKGSCIILLTETNSFINNGKNECKYYVAAYGEAANLFGEEEIGALEKAVEKRIYKSYSDAFISYADLAFEILENGGVPNPIASFLDDIPFLVWVILGIAIFLVIGALALVTGAVLIAAVIIIIVLIIVKSVKKKKAAIKTVHKTNDIRE